MKKLYRATALAMSLFGSAAAFSGAVDTDDVGIVSFSSEYLVTGSIVGANESNNTVEHIECSTTSGVRGNCSAVSANGTSVSGFTTDANLIKTIQTITSNSRIDFLIRKSDSRIINITVKNGSKYL